MAAKILLVEDNPVNLALMEYLLRAFGHVTVSAVEGEAGVALATTERPDLVLMDLHLPRLDGFEAALRMRSMPDLQRTPIVAVTASATIGERARILARGFDGYIAKPITPETFVAQVESFLSRSLPPGAARS
jgi:two-component system cell cycle response regulator